MTETAFPDAVDTFPAEVTLADPIHSFADVDGTGQTHSSMFHRASSAIVALEQRTLGLWYNVKEYGAVGDGVADDTTAISDAIDAAVGAGGGTVWYPAGTYKVTSKKVIASQTATLGIAKGLTLRGTSVLATKILFQPSAAGFAYEIGDAAGSKIASNVTIEDLTIHCNNGTALGALKFVDEAAYCTTRNVQLYGNGTSSGDGILLTGQTVANSHHLFERISIQNFNNCLHLSGFANSSLFSDIWMGVCTVGLLMEATGADTLGGNQNVFQRLEFNGTTTTGIKLRTTAVRNVFIGIVTDGPTTSLDAADGCINNAFVGCTIPISSTTLSGTAATGNTWIACNSRSSDGIAQETRWGEIRAFRSTTNTLTFGAGNDGLSAVNICAVDTFKAVTFRWRDTSRNDKWWATHDTASGALQFHRVGGNDWMAVSSTERVTFGTADAIVIPRMTTAVRDALVTPPDGSLIYNTTAAKFQGREAGAWANLI